MASGWPPTSLPFDDTVTALDTVRDIATGHGLTQIVRRCLATKEQAQQPTLTVAVLGRFKSGKSSLLNQLLGSAILPVQAIPATAVITRVQYSSRLQARVTKDDGESLLVDVADLADWVTETGNPENRRGVRMVTVESPALADLASFVLVDTPGTGSTWGHNTATSREWLPNVGVAILVVNATQPLADDDLALISELARHTPELAVVLSKADLLGEQDRHAVTAHVNQQLSTHLSTVPTLWWYSIMEPYANLRREFRTYLRNVGTTSAGHIADVTSHRLTQLASETHAYLSLASAAASSQEQSRRSLGAALESELNRIPELRRQALAQLHPYEEKIAQQTQARFCAHKATFTRELDDRLTTELPTWTGRLAAQASHFRDWLTAALPQALTPLAEQTARELVGIVGEATASITHLGEAFVQRLREDVRSTLGHDLLVPVPAPTSPDPPPVSVVVDVVFDRQIDLWSWALPMWLMKPLVHGHFHRMVPWQVEKNLLRAAHALATTIASRLRETVGAYCDQLIDVAVTCQRLADANLVDMVSLDGDLAALAAVCAERA